MSSSQVFTPERIRQLRMMGDIKYPTIFSPLATSSPVSNKISRSFREDISCNTSSSDSSANLTQRAAYGVEDSVILGEDDSKILMNTSNVSVHTALEHVDSLALTQHCQPEIVKRSEIFAALTKCAAAEFGPQKAQLIAHIATERILWESCNIWTGEKTVFNKTTYLDQLQKYGCDDVYIRRGVAFCRDEMASISNECCYDRSALEKYLHSISVPRLIIDRIFEANLVRKSKGDRLGTSEIIHLIFAIRGVDDQQSFEYWFRILNLRNHRYLAFDDLRQFYTQIFDFLAERMVESLSFETLCTQYCDMLGNHKWSLSVLKKNPIMASRVLNGFTNALSFFEDETTERMDQERVDDETFGVHRSKWQRFLDHVYDEHYSQSSEESCEVITLE